MTRRSSLPVHLPLSLVLLGGCKDDGPDLTATAGTVTAASAGPTSNPSGNPTAGDPTETAGDPTETAGDPTDTGDPPTTGSDDTGEPAGPHALGVIVLGETHLTTVGTASPSVSASFIPDADTGATAACSKTVAGCQIALVPECIGSCGAGEYCGFDDACQSACVPLCDADCGVDEVCYFSSPGVSACKPIESFDAGVLTFFGTPLAITLFPPYVFMSDADSAPFAPGGAAKIQASGATNAGFEAFEREFTGTEFIQTNPTLDKISLADAFGPGDIPVSWIPGNDEITITATVTSADFKTGTITCEANDAAGNFAVPRAALEAALGGATVSGLTLVITRQRTDRHKDLTTTGTLTGQTVQPVGWLEIVTSSTESHTFEGCGSLTLCGDTCIDTQTSVEHCGGCDEPCVENGPTLCHQGSCAGPTICAACVEETEAGPCKAENDACAQNPGCAAIEQCVNDCADDDMSCKLECGEMVQNPAIITLYNNQLYCACASCMNKCLVCPWACDGICVL
ncbi:hypothetical protein [Nannocystis sp. SCPEA4]|uniref:hypothetical protein n=1 Tax=Nannocystis sp. SCPEA4 TaxID=2996787 RepID=UPI002271D1E9|nr:hypothetical protein [Nannocystis sp. SCPEA4]MCY1062169.1 hypothetical protein [Nannocystis sp. SCPEA4]